MTAWRRQSLLRVALIAATLAVLAWWVTHAGTARAQGAAPVCVGAPCTVSALTSTNVNNSGTVQTVGIDAGTIWASVAVQAPIVDAGTVQANTVQDRTAASQLGLGTTRNALSFNGTTQLSVQAGAVIVDAGTTVFTGNVIPNAAGTKNLGGTGAEWATIYGQAIADTDNDTRFVALNNSDTDMIGNVSDGASAVACMSRNAVTLSNAGAIIHLFNAGSAGTTRKAAIYASGDLFLAAGVDAGAQIITTSTVRGTQHLIAADAAPVFHVANQANQQASEHGRATLVAGTKTVSFNTAFAAAPDCFCQDGTAIASCDIPTGTVTTSQFVVNGTGADIVMWQCTGDR